MPPSRVIVPFADRGSAYGFVAELRRLYDLERWVALRVERAGDGALVELPAEEVSVDVLDLATRRGGRVRLERHEQWVLQDAVAQLRHERDRRTGRRQARGAAEHMASSAPVEAAADPPPVPAALHLAVSVRRSLHVRRVFGRIAWLRRPHAWIRKAPPRRRWA